MIIHLILITSYKMSFHRKTDSHLYMFPEIPIGMEQIYFPPSWTEVDHVVVIKGYIAIATMANTQLENFERLLIFGGGFMNECLRKTNCWM